jgi:hypothetical protein
MFVYSLNSQSPDAAEQSGKVPASITLLSIFLPIDTFFRKMILRGVERPIVAAKH